MFTKFIAILSLFIFACACSGIRQVAVDSTADILYRASFDIQSENSWENFEKSVLPNLKMAEGMLSLRPDNLDILATLTKGYAGYALAVNETLLLAEGFSSREEGHKTSAIINYSKAVEFGLRYLKIRELAYENLSKIINEEKEFQILLDAKLKAADVRDREVVLYSAMALSSLINLQKDKTFLIAQLPVAKNMMDWVCNHDPDIAFGACTLFYAAYEAGRPKILGGDPLKGQHLFLQAMKRFPDNYLINILYMQYYLLPQLDEQGFKKQFDLLVEAQTQFEAQRQWTPFIQTSQPHASVKIYQAIAFKRLNILKLHLKELF